GRWPHHARRLYHESFDVRAFDRERHRSGLCVPDLKTHGLPAGSDYRDASAIEPWRRRRRRFVAPEPRRFADYCERRAWFRVLARDRGNGAHCHRCHATGRFHRRHVTAPIIAFAKDWHEDPTSNHHVLRELARTRRVLWLNSIATRKPSLASG